MKTFYFKPDTSENNFSEIITFNNDIITSFSGKEQRILLVQQPRYSVEFSYSFFGKELNNFNSFIYNNQVKENYIPIWFNSDFIEENYINGDTIYITTLYKDYFVGQKIMLIDGLNNYDVATIKTINHNNIVIEEENLSRSYDAFSTDLVPLKIGRLKSTLSKTLLTANVAKVTLSFDIKVSDDKIIDDVDVSFPIYDDKFLILKQPNRINPISQVFNRNVYELDLGFGVREFEELQDQYFINYNYIHELTTRKEINEYKSFINKISGRQKSFYMPSFEVDFIHQENIEYLSTNNELIVNKQNKENYKDTFGQKKRKIIIIFKDSTYLINEIIDSNSIDDEFESLLLTENFTSDFNSNEIDHIMFLNESRFLNDTFVFEYLTNDICRINKNIRILKYKDL